MNLKISQEQIQQISDSLNKLWNWIKEIFVKIMKPIVSWIKAKYYDINLFYVKYRKYLKYQKKVKNRQALYLKRRRIYGK